jgi:hypothetical protein
MMAARFLLDEHFPHAYKQALSRADATVDVWMIGEPGAPPHGASDPEILRWRETEGAMLLTNDRRTMPGHLAAHLSDGGHILGLFTVDPARDRARIVEDLVLFAGAAIDSEFSDRITYLPLS